MGHLQKETEKPTTVTPGRESRVGQLVFVYTLQDYLQFLPYAYILSKFEN